MEQSGSRDERSDDGDVLAKRSLVSSSRAPWRASCLVWRVGTWPLTTTRPLDSWTTEIPDPPVCQLAHPVRDSVRDRDCITRGLVARHRFLLLLMEN